VTITYCLLPNLPGVKGVLTKQQLPLEIHFIPHQVNDKLYQKYRAKKLKSKKLTWQEDRRALYSPTTTQQ